MATTGLMSLAYIAELAVVFNLAYAELHRGRYMRRTLKAFVDLKRQISPEDAGKFDDDLIIEGHEGMQDFVERTVLEIGRDTATDSRATASVVNNDDLPHLSEYLHKLRHFFHRENKHRVGCWIFERNRGAFLLGKNGCYWFSCRYSYWLFRRGLDRVVALGGLAVATIILVACTWIDGPVLSACIMSVCGPAAARRTELADTVYPLFFWILLACLMIPAPLIVCGRRMDTVARRVAAAMTHQWTTTISKTLIKQVEAIPAPSSPR